MKKKCFITFTVLFLVYTSSCDNYPVPADNIIVPYDNPDDKTNSPEPGELQRLRDLGQPVAARKYSSEYDCSNYSTQFYQDCYKRGIKCRVTVGISGGSSFSEGPHAWNTVKINEIWEPFEPQLGDVYYAHKTTKTPLGPGWGDFSSEDLVVLMYELIGRLVPSSVIDRYEIDSHLMTKSPFNFYFNGYNLSDDPSYNAFVNQLKIHAPHDGDGVISISRDQQHLLFAYNYRMRFLGIDRLEENNPADPVKGRSIANQNTLKYDFTTANEFITDLHLY